MAKSSQDPEPGATPDQAPATATPRWVKVFGGILGIVVLLFIILLLTKGPGGHGPSRHLPSGELGGAPAGSTIDGPLPGGGNG